jgi:hypothetical protein
VSSLASTRYGPGRTGVNVGLGSRRVPSRSYLGLGCGSFGDIAGGFQRLIPIVFGLSIGVLRLILVTLVWLPKL